MARGWESKDVESQLEQAEAERRAARARKPSPQEAELARRRESLGLDRARLEREIAESRHPRRIEQLRAALAHIDAEISKL